MNVRVDWQQLAAVTVVVTALGGFVWRLLLGRAAAVFVSRRVHEELVGRVTVVEMVQRSAPTSADLIALTARIAAVETGVAVSTATLTGVSDGVKRVEKMVDLLVQHQLNGETAS